MEPTTIILGLMTTLLGLIANTLVMILFWRFKQMDQDIDQLKTEMTAIRLNYMNRFDDIKEHQNRLHLELIKKVSILETLLNERLN